MSGNGGGVGIINDSDNVNMDNLIINNNEGG